MKRSAFYAAVIAFVLAGSMAVPSQAAVRYPAASYGASDLQRGRAAGDLTLAAMKMVVMGGGSCAGQESACPQGNAFGQGSCTGQSSLNDLLSKWTNGSCRDLGTGGSGCGTDWGGLLSGWCIPGGMGAGGGCKGSCPVDDFWDCDGANGGNGSGNGPDITVPDEGVPGTELPGTDQPGTGLPGQWQPDEDSQYPSYDDSTDRSVYVQQVISLVNQERSKAGLPALKESAQLSAAAEVRARELPSSFGHVRPDGSSFSTAISQKKIAFNGAGENIAYGQRTPQEVMNDWMDSQSHREAILNARYTTIGVACYQDRNGTLYWTQLFTY